MKGRQETPAVVETPRQDAGYTKLASAHMKTARSDAGIQGRVEMCQATEDFLLEDLGALSTTMILLAARTKGKRRYSAHTEIEGQAREDNIKHIERILDNLSSQCYISLPFPTQEDHLDATSTAINSNNVLPNFPLPILRCSSRSSLQTKN